MASIVHGSLTQERSAPGRADPAAAPVHVPAPADGQPQAPAPPQEDDSAVATAVVVRDLVRRFGDHTVLDRLGLTLPAGQFAALLGASGCGKSTLLRILAGLDTEIEGDVEVPVRRAVAFQAPRLLPWKRVWRNVTIGLPSGRDKARAMAALDEVGLSHRAGAWPKTLSGGEAQRTSLARALIREPELLLLDEPFAALDALTRLKAQALVERLWKRHAPAVLLVTHDVEEALRLADRVLVMRSGVIAHDAAVDLPRPRNVADPAFAALRADLLGRLGVDPADIGEAPADKALVAGERA